MPQETKSHVDHESSARQGMVYEGIRGQKLASAVEQAVDYRGDVAVTRTGGVTVVGYVFDRKETGDPATSTLRMMPTGTNDRVEVRFSEIERIEFTGKDTAEGKTFENWVRRYAEKKLAGETASIESEELEGS